MKIPKLPPRIRCFDLMPVVAGVVVLSFAGGSVIAQQPPELQPIDWVLGANAQLTTNPGGIKRPTGGSAGWNAGAISSQRILRDGRLEFKASPGCQAMLGLSVDSVSDASAEIDYAIYLIPSGTSLTSGTAQIYQNTSVAATANTAGASLGSYTSTTVFAIRRTGSQVQYLKDGIVMGTATVPSAGMLLVDSSFYKQGSTITSAHVYTGDLDEDRMPDAWEKSYLPPDHGWNDVVKFTWDGHADADGVTNRMEFEDGSDPTDALSYLAPVSWGSRVHTTTVGTDGGLLRSTTAGAIAWNADAVSSVDIPEDGKVVFRVPLGSYLSVGLTYANNDRLTTDLEYRIVVKNTNQAEFVRPESATAVTMGSYTADTVFAIQRVNGKVQFLKDGVVIGSPSTTVSSGPLIVDCSLYGVSTEIAMCRLYTGDLDNDEMPDAWELSYLPANAGYAQLDAFKPTGSASDPDDDGIQNLHEYYDGTHPFRKLLQPASILWQPAPANYLSVIGTQGGVKKISTIAGWNADAVASKLDTNNTVVPLIMGQTGRLSFTANPGSSLAMGFTAANGYRTQNDLEYMIQLTSASPGQASVYEGTGSTTAATLKDALGAYDASTHFSIRRVARQVDYFKNGQLFHSSTVPAYLPLLVDSSFNATNSEVTAARLYTGDVDGDELPDDWEIDLYQRQQNGSLPTFAQLQTFTDSGNHDGDSFTNLQEYRHGSDPLQQTSLPTAITWEAFTATSNQHAVAGTVVAGGYLRKTGATAGYNADATSVESLTGDGVLSFTVAPGILAVGLTTTAGASNTNNADTDLRYAFVLSATDAKVQRPDSATDLSVGAYTASTVFAIRRTSGVIEFLKDGLVVETSITPSAGTVYADCSLSAVGTQITSAYLNDGDLDNDGLPDAWELQNLTGSLPAFADITLAQLGAFTQESFGPDNDGVTNLDEYLNGTSAILSDTDGDGMSDRWEIDQGFAAADASNATADADDDGLNNLGEFQAGTDPQDYDSDNDGISDGDEVLGNTNPNNADTDNDGLPDSYEIQNGLLPLDADDAFADKDGDRVPNLWEFARGTLVGNASSTPTYDAIVDPTLTADNAAAHQFRTPQGAYNHVSTSPTYRSVILCKRGVHTMPSSSYPNGLNKSVTWLGELGGDRASGLNGTVWTNGNFVPGGDTVVDGIILEGQGYATNGPLVQRSYSTTVTTLRFVNCLLRNAHGPAYDAQDNEIAGALLTYNTKVWFIHCSVISCASVDQNDNGGPTIKVYGPQGGLRFVNSIVWDRQYDNIADVILNYGAPAPALTSILQGDGYGAPPTNPHLTADGMLTSVSATSRGTGTPGQVTRDIHGEPRSSTSADIGADQWVNTDADDLPDHWEQFWVGSLYPANPHNPDTDGVNHHYEYLLGTKPLVADTNGNGTHDGNEDADDDGLTNATEQLLNLDPLLADSDGNGISDPNEDTDEDDLTNIDEINRGTDPSEADTDGDDLPDGWEVAHGTDPLVSDGLDADRDGLSNALEFTLDLNPLRADSNNNGVNDGDEDSDGDGVTNRDDNEDPPGPEDVSLSPPGSFRISYKFISGSIYCDEGIVIDRAVLTHQGIVFQDQVDAHHGPTTPQRIVDAWDELIPTLEGRLPNYAPQIILWDGTQDVLVGTSIENLYDVGAYYRSSFYWESEPYLDGYYCSKMKADSGGCAEWREIKLENLTAAPTLRRYRLEVFRPGYGWEGTVPGTEIAGPNLLGAIEITIPANTTNLNFSIPANLSTYIRCTKTPGSLTFLLHPPSTDFPTEEINVPRLVTVFRAHDHPADVILDATTLSSYSYDTTRWSLLSGLFPKPFTGGSASYYLHEPLHQGREPFIVQSNHWQSWSFTTHTWDGVNRKMPPPKTFLASKQLIPMGSNGEPNGPTVTESSAPLTIDFRKFQRARMTLGGVVEGIGLSEAAKRINFTPDYQFGNTVELNLLPVEFKKMWETKNKANQIVVKAKRDDPKDDKQTADADGNLYGTPRYLLYVTADPSDSKYHVSLDCDLGGQRDQFVCAAYNGGTKISGSDKAFPAASDQPADMLIPATGSDQSSQDLIIKIAFDANKNGLIDASEPLIDLTAAKSESGSPAPPMIRGFSMAAVNAAKTTIHGQATGSGFTGWKPNLLGEWFVPNAQALERLFYDGAIGGMVQDYQPTTTLGPANLSAFGPPGDFNEWLTHHAGSNFNADGVTTVQHYYWNPSKRISNLIANSSPLSLLKSNSTITSQITNVTDATVENFKQPSVPVGQTQTFPSGAAGYDLQPVLAGLGAPHSSPAWVPKQTLLVGDQDGYAGAIPDDAFGTVGRSRFINGEYRFIVKKEARVQHFSTGDPGGYDIPYTAVVVYLRVSGSSQDLYDFNHNGGGLSIPAAITQLSYGNGGYGRTNGVIFRATVDILKDYEVKEIRLP